MKYKLSKFNTAVKENDKFIYHNSFTNNFLLLEELLLEMISAASEENDIIGLKEYHPSLFDSLLSLGFIIDENINEIEEVKKMIYKIDNDESYYKLIVNPTMNCNFKCWYCYEDHIKDSKLKEDVLNSIFKLIDNISQKEELKTFVLSFFGGEPFLYYKKVIEPIIEYTRKTFDENKVTIQISFTTNGYLLNDEIVTKLVDFRVTDLQITLDGYKDFHDKVRFVSKTKGSYDEIIQNIKRLTLAGLPVTMRINYTNNNFDSVQNIISDFDDLNKDAKSLILVSLHRVWQDEYTNLGTKIEQLMQDFKKSDFTINDSAYADTVRHSCYADKKNQATINYNGEVFKCTARDFTSSTKEGNLNENGEIEWNENFDNRMTVKLKNPPCHSCSILPICGGGCSQHALENLKKNQDYCVYNFDEDRKKSLVKSIFLNSKNLVSV